MRTCVAQTQGPAHPTPSQRSSGDLPRRCGASASNSARSVPARRDHASKHSPRKSLQETVRTVRTVSLPKKTCKTNKNRLTMLTVRLTVLTVRRLRTVSTKALQTADSLTALTILTMIRAKILKKIALGKAPLLDTTAGEARHDHRGGNSGQNFL